MSRKRFADPALVELLSAAQELLADYSTERAAMAAAAAECGPGGEPDPRDLDYLAHMDQTIDRTRRAIERVERAIEAAKAERLV